MRNTKKNQAVLIVTTNLNKPALKFYNLLKKATVKTADVYFLYHTKKETVWAPTLDDVKIETFDNEILTGLGYKAIRNKLVPGSNHFPVLKFFLEHQEYDYYWCIEDDVVFNGNWKDFFKKVSPQLDYDFIASHIRNYNDMPEWLWWREFYYPEGRFTKEEYFSSFNPIYRISNKALNFLDTCLKDGYSGHHEILISTLLKKENFTIADFGKENNEITQRLSLCTEKTMRFRPVFLFLGRSKNMLYHPVKQKINFKQFYIYIKRSLTNKKRYRRTIK